jgi:peptidoglycan/LPS O-acetylase OafA/YrhL
LIPAVTTEPTAAIDQQLPYYFYLQNLTDIFHWRSYGPGHFWSLAVEENFYLLWPFLVFFISEKWLTRLIIFFVAVSFAVRVLLLMKGIGGQYFIMSSFDALALGSLLALKEAKSGLKAENGMKYFAILILFLFPSIVFWFIMNKHAPKAIQVLDFPVITIVYLCLVAGLVSFKNSAIVNKVFCSAPLLYLGKISYGMYVYHTLCFYFYFKHFSSGNVLVDLPVTFLIAITIASLSYYYFEIPFLKLKDKFAVKKS